VKILPVERRPGAKIFAGGLISGCGHFFAGLGYNVDAEGQEDNLVQATL
jgi:hypothetical protein